MTCKGSDVGRGKEKSGVLCALRSRNTGHRDCATHFAAELQSDLRSDGSCSCSDLSSDALGADKGQGGYPLIPRQRFSRFPLTGDDDLYHFGTVTMRGEARTYRSSVV